MKIVPAVQRDELIEEVDPDVTFAAIAEARKTTEFHDFVIEGEAYSINVRNNRYELLDAHRSCACCGIHGTKMFLGIFEENGTIGYNFRLFAETKDNPKSIPHLILMTKDHIVPKRQGGSDDPSNWQTLCYLCNIFKDTLDVSIEQIQEGLFTSYRIYRGSLNLRRVRERLRPYRIIVEGSRVAVRSIDAGLSRAKPESRPKMIAKREQFVRDAAEVERLITAIEKRAQATGTSPSTSVLEELCRSLRIPVPRSVSARSASNLSLRKT